MPKVAFKTLGCRLNQAETDQMAEDLAAIGFQIVRENEGPDLVIVNTCTVTSEATKGSRKTAAVAAKNNEQAQVIVAGCYAVAEPEEAASIPGVAGVLSNEEKGRVAQIVSKKLGLPPARDPILPLLQIGKGTPGVPGSERTRVNLKVQTGCDEFCTFCIIPKTRGPLHSYDLNELLRRARRQVSLGARELVLTGVHLGKYGWDTGRPDDYLIELLEGLLAIDDLARIRLSSILCRHVTDRLVSLLRDEPRLCRFLHVPIQSGDDEILRAMNRPYCIGDFHEAVDRVKEAVPGVGLSTDVIVGFPGETAGRFERTVEAVERVRFMKLHVFRYSPRSGTPSATWDTQIPEPEKRLRSKELIAVGNRLREEFNAAHVGRSCEVLVEQAFENGELVGHCDNFLRVRFSGSESLVERLARVRIDSAAIESVRGELIEEVPWEEANPRS